MSKDNVIKLEFKSPHVEEEGQQMLACGYCRNKTYTLCLDKAEDFPLMKCAACGQHMGRMGWAHDDDQTIDTEPVG